MLYYATFSSYSSYFVKSKKNLKNQPVIINIWFGMNIVDIEASGDEPI